MLDLFAYSAERKNELKLVAQYETDLKKFLPLYKLSNRHLLEQMALLPMEIKGFGHVKEEAITKSKKIRTNLVGIISGDYPSEKLSAAE